MSNIRVKYTYFTAAIQASFFLTGCWYFYGFNGERMEGNGSVTEEERTAGDFTALGVSENIDAVIEQSGENSEY